MFRHIQMLCLASVLMGCILLGSAYRIVEAAPAVRLAVSTQPTGLQAVLHRRIAPDSSFRTVFDARILRTLRPGDILLRRTTLTGCTVAEPVVGCRRWAAVYDSAALYLGDNTGTPTLYTAAPRGGVRVIGLRTWLSPGAYVAVYRARTRTTPTTTSLARFVHNYGSTGQTAFNRMQSDKTDDRQLTSAQLVWQYYRRHGLDLDSNTELYAQWLRIGYSPWVSAAVARHAVAPDELALSAALTRLGAGRIP
jgi:hypothetical protein